MRPRPNGRRRRNLAGAVLATLLLVVSACTGSGDLASSESNSRGEPADGGSSDGLEWTSCVTELAALAELECASLSVPMDRADPEAGEIDLALARSVATGSPEQRIGSLLLNPGGPGGSGIEFLANAALAMPAEIQQSFDLVSWDPRGVAESTPVRCLTDEEKDAQFEGDISPDEQAEFDRAVEDTAEFREACETNHPELIEHMSTADVAGDLEEIRVALGDGQLNYVGFSYGTSIGATYATLFPENVRAMVLDGSVSPSATAEEQLAVGANSFERTYASFVETCDGDPDCALSGRTAETVEEVRSTLDAEPLEYPTASGTRELTRDLFDIGLLTAMYQSEIWGTVASAVDDLEGGGAEVILTLADSQIGREPDGSWDNSTDAQTMVNCADQPERPTVEEALEAGRRATADAPTFGEVLATGLLGCVDWPLPANPVPAWTAAGAPPILVVGTLGDPATPYEWSEEMAATLQGSVLLTYEGDGHTAFLRGGDCINDAVVDYLVELTLPEAGTSCPEVTAGADGGIAEIEDLLLDQLTAGGIPESVANCIVEGLRDELGEDGLQELLLGGDPDELTSLVGRITTQCMAGN